MAELPHSDYFKMDWTVVVDDGSQARGRWAKVFLGMILVGILVSILWWWNQSLKLGGNQLVWLMIPFILSIVAVLVYFWIQMTTRFVGKIKKFAVNKQGIVSDRQQWGWGELKAEEVVVRVGDLEAKGSESEYFEQVEGVMGFELPLTRGGKVRVEVNTEKSLKKVAKAVRMYLEVN